ncbi:MAG: nucleotidyltransferase family protein [Xanthomonadales bacterium]|nr:nucleotidyltransferase family protein [Xanthomonadales bacterium]
MPEPAHLALLLAAGGSRRLGQPKQLLDLNGISLIRRMALAALATEPTELLVSLGAEVEGCRAALQGLRWREVLVADWTEGMGRSLAAGVEAITNPALAVLVLGVDQPALDAAHLRALVALGRERPDCAVASAYADTLGIPALFPAEWRPRLAALGGDLGARVLLRSGDPSVLSVPAPQLAIDIDTPADLGSLRP